MCVPMRPLLLARGHKNDDNNVAAIIIGLPRLNTRKIRPPVVKELLVYFPSDDKPNTMPHVY